MHKTGTSCRAQVIEQTASNNKKQIRDMYRAMDDLATSIRCGAHDDDMLSPKHQEAIKVLSRYVHGHAGACYVSTLTPSSNIKRIEEDLESILQERKSRFKRFFSAKRHRSELQDIVKQLERADTNYMVRYSAVYYALEMTTRPVRSGWWLPCTLYLSPRCAAS